MGEDDDGATLREAVRVAIDALRALAELAFHDGQTTLASTALDGIELLTPYAKA